MGFDRFELRRLSDDLVYSFRRAIRADGRPGYKRDDADLWIVWDKIKGWVAIDDANDAVMGRPWDVAPEDQVEDHPPEGEWVSKKGVRSYVYALVYV